MSATADDTVASETTQPVRDTASPTTHGWGAWALGAALFALAVVLPLFRQRGTHSWQTIWGEDGFIFYQQAADSGGVHVLFRGYAGYAVLPARLFAIPAQLVPLGNLAHYEAITAAVVCALLALLVYHASRGWISSRIVRLAIASLVVLMPAAGFETTATTTNTIWAFAAVAPWAIISLDDRWRSVAARAAVVFLAATGLPLTFLFLPLALVWAYLRRTRGVYVVLASLCVGLALQGMTMLRTTAELVPVKPQRPISGLIDLGSTRLFGLTVFGPNQAIDLWNDHGRTPGLIAGVVLLGLFVLAFIGTERRAQVLGGTFFVLGLAEFAILIWGRGILPFTFGHNGVIDMAAHMRYSVASTLMLSSAFAVLLSPIGSVARDRLIARVGRIVLVAHIVLLTVVTFRVDTYRSTSPVWATEVIHARNECAAKGPQARVSIPQDVTPFWVVKVPCRELR